MRVRNKAFLLWLTESEMNKLKNDAKIAGLTQQEYVRQSLKGVVINEKPPEVLFEILRELRLIGNNMNQISMRFNSTNHLDALQYKKNYESLQKTISDIFSRYF